MHCICISILGALLVESYLTYFPDELACPTASANLWVDVLGARRAGGDW